MAYQVTSHIECDTVKLNEAADKILEILVEYEARINTMFGRLDFATDQDPWFGNNAFLYASLAMDHKQEFIDYGENVKNIAKEIKAFVEDLDSQIKENEEICEKAEDNYVGWY